MLRRRGPELDPGVGEVLREHVARLLGCRPHLDGLRRLQRVAQALRHAPSPAHDHERGGVHRPVEVRHQRRDVARAEVPRLVDHDDTPCAHERRALRGVERGGDDLFAAFRSARRVALGLAGRRPARHRELLDRQRAVVVTDELGDELFERFATQHRIGPGHLIDGGAHSILRPPSQAPAPVPTVGKAAVVTGRAPGRSRALAPPRSSGTP